MEMEDETQGWKDIEALPALLEEMRAEGKKAAEMERVLTAESRR